MENLIASLAFVLIPALYLVCFAGLTWSFLRAVQAGAQAYEEVYSEQTSRQYADIFFFIPPRQIVEMAWTAAMAAFVILFFLVGNFRSVGGALRGLIVGGLAALLVLALPRRILILLKKRRLLQFNEQLVDALMTMSNALRSGASILQAFEHIVQQNLNPISQEFSLFLQQTRLGVSFEEALTNLDKRVNCEDLTLMIRAIELARQTGGNLTEVFERISATIRERFRIQARVRTLTAQGRLQGVVVGILPVILALAMFTIDPPMMIGFFTSPIGLLTAGVVLLLEIIGALLIRKIIAIDI